METNILQTAASNLGRELMQTKAILDRPRVMLDFETRSFVNLNDVGAFVYSRDKSTQILIVTWQFQAYGDEPAGETRIWTAGNPAPKELIDAAHSERFQLNAFNSFFEYCIWQNVAANRLGWGHLKGVNQILDVQDKAKTMALPASLGELGEVTDGLVKKDKEGTRLIQKFCVPRRITKANPHQTFNNPWTPEHRADWELFQNYAKRDTEAQVYQDVTLPDLMVKEQLAAFMTNEMNWRGIHIDMAAVKAANYLVSEIKEIYNTRASRLSGGAFEKCTQRAKVKEWLLSQGNPMKDMQGDTVDMELRKKLPKHIRKMLEYYKVAGSTSVAKYAKLLHTIDPVTRRVHEILSFHRARTGRWGGRGFQIHNLPRPVMPKGTDYGKVVEQIKHFARTKDVKGFEKYCKTFKCTPTQVLFSCIRSVMTPLYGDRYICGDYSSIEARCLLWEAQDSRALDIFRRKEDIYLDMASDIYSVPLKSLNKESKERPLGKEAVLGCGFGMGWKKFRDRVDSQAGIQISAAESKRVIDTYRKKFKSVPALWEYLERLAMAAMLKHHGKNVPKEYRVDHPKYTKLREQLDLSYLVKKYGNVYYLICILPNGKRLYYPHPKIRRDRFDRGFCVEYEGVEAYNAGASTGSKGGKWGKVDTYGGKLAENITQAIARELMTGGMLMLRAGEYQLFLTVHDEVGAEQEIGVGSVKEFNILMGFLPKWAQGIPMELETWEGFRYRK